jgi:trans-aconitate 2-methyltransferase
MRWDPGQYLRFADERTRPAVDLLARIPHEARSLVFDMGCGPGNTTRLLRARWPAADLTGIDSSAEMLDRAAREVPGARWVQADLAGWRPDRPADVLFSNATFQWLDDHDRLFPALLDCLTPGGVLAVQMPRNFDAPSHTALAEVVRSGPWRERLEHLLRLAPVGTPASYYDLLAPRAASVDVWETEYVHVLRGEDPVKEWTKGTALKPFLDALEGEEGREFEERYAALLREAYPRRPDGTTLFPFRRLFIVSVRS